MKRFEAFFDSFVLTLSLCLVFLGTYMIAKGLLNKKQYNTSQILFRSHVMTLVVDKSLPKEINETLLKFYQASQQAQVEIIPAACQQINQFEAACAPYSTLKFVSSKNLDSKLSEMSLDGEVLTIALNEEAFQSFDQNQTAQAVLMNLSTVTYFSTSGQQEQEIQEEVYY